MLHGKVFHGNEALFKHKIHFKYIFGFDYLFLLIKNVTVHSVTFVAYNLVVS